MKNVLPPPIIRAQSIGVEDHSVFKKRPTSAPPDKEKQSQTEAKNNNYENFDKKDSEQELLKDDHSDHLM